MHMFRRKRNNLTKRLFSARKRQTDFNQNEKRSEDEVKLRLFDHLKDGQLELLASAVENEGAILSNCVLLPRNELNCGVYAEPHVLCCRLYRWPDILSSGELKRLPVCESAHDPVYICCNPYHLSRMTTVEINGKFRILFTSS